MRPLVVQGVQPRQHGALAADALPELERIAKDDANAKVRENAR
jgi:hypothetical protein